MSSPFPTDMPPDVRAAFLALPQDHHPCLAALRAMVFEVAASDSRIGRLEETLKWGEPAYLTPVSKSGSTVRLGVPKANPDRVAVYFNCNTGLVDRFRTAFPDLTCVGIRAVLVAPEHTLPPELPLCIAQALTWHLIKADRVG